MEAAAAQAALEVSVEAAATAALDPEPEVQWHDQVEAAAAAAALEAPIEAAPATAQAATQSSETARKKSKKSLVQKFSFSTPFRVK